MRKLIISIGNPGKAYQNTYHNAGHAFLDVLADTLGQSFRHAARYDSLSFEHDGAKHVLAKSNLFMNESGLAVLAAMRQFRLTSKELLLVHDDTDLPLGTVKFSEGSGAAGHKGVASVITHLHTQNFSRLRIGVRPPHPGASGRRKAGEFVLRKMPKGHQTLLYGAFDELTTKVMENEARPSSSATKEPIGS